jgi:uncharacterized ion transporter superfamily protein YfcC
MNLSSWIIIVLLVIFVFFLAFTVFWMLIYSKRIAKSREAMAGMSRSIDELKKKAQKTFKTN